MNIHPPKTLTAVVVLLALATSASYADVIVNGSFEQDVVPPGQTFPFQPSGWIVSPPGEGYLVRGTIGPFPPPVPFPDGDQVFGVRTDGTTISQDFSLASLSILDLTYWDAHETGSGIIGLTSWATITDLSSGTVLATSPQFQANVNDTWKLNSWLAGVFDAGNYRLTLRLGGEAVYDDVRLTAAAIPEPSVGILMLLGAAVSLIARRLGRRAKA